MGKVDLERYLKGAAKLACSYVADSAKDLSKNKHFTEEARSQFGEISESFSDVRDRLDYTPQAEDAEDFEDFEDEFELHDSEVSETTSDIHPTSNIASQRTQKSPMTSIFNQITFAGYQWYVLYRDDSRNTALLLSKDIVQLMPFSSGRSIRFEDSLVYKWLKTDFHSILKSKLKTKDSERLRSISLLSSAEIEKYMPKGKSRVAANFNATAEWWLSDSKKESVKVVSSTGTIGLKKTSDKCGVRPVIMISLKNKS